MAILSQGLSSLGLIVDQRATGLTYLFVTTLAMPQVFGELERTYQKLEAHYRDMQDLEFTVERGTLYMLQTRNGKRTAKAALKIARRWSVTRSPFSVR